LAGHVEDAHACADRALALVRERGERGHEAWALRLMGEIHAHGDLSQAGIAEGRYREALALATELGIRPLLPHCHPALATPYGRTGDQAKAHEHLTTAATMYREMGMTFWLEKARDPKADVFSGK